MWWCCDTVFSSARALKRPALVPVQSVLSATASGQDVCIPPQLKHSFAPHRPPRRDPWGYRPLFVAVYYCFLQIKKLQSHLRSRIHSRARISSHAPTQLRVPVLHNISGAHWRTGRAGVGLCPESRGERARGGWKEGKEENKIVNRSSHPLPPSWELHAWSTPSIAEHSEFAMAEHSADMTPSLLVDPDEKKQKMDHGHGHSHDHADGSAPAKIVALGTVTLGGATFMTRSRTLVN